MRPRPPRTPKGAVAKQECDSNLHKKQCKSRSPEPFLSLLALKRFRVLCIFFQRAILQQPLLHQNQAKTATITCMATPTKAPAAHVRPVMKRFCFQEGFARQSTARPTPAPVHRPATRLEKRRAPST